MQTDNLSIKSRQLKWSFAIDLRPFLRKVGVIVIVGSQDNMVVSDLHIKFLKRINISFQDERHLFSLEQKGVLLIELFVLILATFFNGNYCLQNVSNLNAFIEGFSVFLTAILSTAKAFSFTSKKASFFKLNEKINEMSRNVGGNSKEKLVRINEIIKSIVQLYYFCVCLTGVYFILLPTYSFLWEVYVVRTNETVVREVPMFAQ